MSSGSDVSYIVKFSAEPSLPLSASSLGRATGRDRQEMLRILKTLAQRSQYTVRTLMKGRATKMTTLWAVNALSATSSPDLVTVIAADPNVKSIDLDTLVHAPVPTLAQESAAEWNLNVTGATSLWEQNITGEGVVLANMDTGVDMVHPDIRRRWRRGINSWYDPNGEHSSPYDSDGHGTQTMGIMVGGNASGSAIGMAPDAKWIAVKIFNDAGVASISTIHQAFQWLLDPDNDINTDDAPDVINGSWGFSDLMGQCFGEFEQDIALLRLAGINISLAAGNQGPGAESSISPANNTSGYAVGAVDDSLNVASFS
ncbi:MAG: S8 family serine peptidase, partial [Chromatiales bacterium]|nr:S8 family serine peptidase [Chromatiales bacterium]